MIIKPKKRAIDLEIDRIYELLAANEPGSEEYEELIKHLTSLESIGKAKTIDIPWSVVIPAVTSLTGILLILKFEKFDAITTKAIGFVSKAKI